MPTSFELKERHRAVDNAVATQRLEGLEPDSKTIAELQRVADGTLSISDLLNMLHSRISAGDFRSPAIDQ